MLKKIKSSDLACTLYNRGNHKIKFNGEALPSGVYLIALTAKNANTNRLISLTQKIVLLK